MTLRVPAVHNIARLYQPTPERVRQAIIRLYDARPPFSYEPLYEAVQASLRLKDPLSKYRAIVEGWGPSIRRDSYLRALQPTELFFRNFARSYEVEIAPRVYSIGRGLQAPFAPRLLCGTIDGPVIPWLLFWKDNPLTEEQTALLHSIVLDAFSSDPDLEDAKLMLVDTSVKALGCGGVPRVTASGELPVVSPSGMRAMLDVFVKGLLMAEEQLRARTQSQVAHRYEHRPSDSRGDQPGLFE